MVRQTILLISLLSLFLLTACFALPTEAPVLPPPTITVLEAPILSTVAVARGNVQMIAPIPASYMPAREVRLMFDEGDIPLLGIFVANGDPVQEGDIIAALDLPHIQAELEHHESRRTRLTLELRQLEEQHNLALDLAERSGNPADDLHFIRRRADILQEMSVIDMYIVYLRQLDETRYLRAPISGVASRVAGFTVGMYSQANRLIATITDHDYTAFVVRSPMANYMNPGDNYEMTFGGNTFLMQVVDYSEAGFIRNETFPFEAFLVFIDEPPTLAGTAIGQVLVDLGQVDDVLYIPTTALVRAGDDRTFVYVLENGLRTVRDVVIGLEGNNEVEIVSGLIEGELVVR